MRVTKQLWALAMVLWGCSSEHSATTLAPDTIGSLVVIEWADGIAYRMLAPGGPVAIDDEIPDDARVVVAGYGASLDALGLIGEDGRLRLAGPQVPLDLTAPLPVPHELWEGPLGGPYTSRDVVTWAESRPERIELDGCPRLTDARIRIDHSHRTPVFLSPSSAGVWVVQPDEGHANGAAFHCTRQCEPSTTFPRRITRPVAALDHERAPWFVRDRQLVRGLEGEPTASIALTASVGEPLGIAFTSRWVGVLDRDDRLHLLDREGSGSWSTRDLSTGLPAGPAACTIAGSTFPLWLRDDGSASALLAGACRLVEVGPGPAGVVVDPFPGAASSGLAYSRDGALEALLMVPASGRAMVVHWKLGAGPWEEVDFGGRSPGGVEVEAVGPTVAVVGSDVFSVMDDPNASVESVLSAHRWLHRPELSPIACAPQELGVAALAPGFGGLVAIRLHTEVPNLARISITR